MAEVRTAEVGMGEVRTAASVEVRTVEVDTVEVRTVEVRTVVMDICRLLTEDMVWDIVHTEADISVVCPDA